MFLRSQHSHRNQTAVQEALELTLYRATTRASQLHYLGNKEASVGLTEQSAQDTLLCGGK